MNDRLTQMIEAQHRLQVASNSDPLEMDLLQRIDYIKDMVLACTDELHEALNEIGWKTWASSRHINATHAFGELRDAWQFLTNAMLAVEQQSPEALADALEAALYEKLTRNHQRVQNLYTGLNKCPGCRRALDEVPPIDIQINDHLRRRLCSGCGADLPTPAITTL